LSPRGEVGPRGPLVPLKSRMCPPQGRTKGWMFTLTLRGQSSHPGANSCCKNWPGESAGFWRFSWIREVKV
jgi:hypothetical protein